MGKKYCWIEDRPCRISDLKFSEIGKLRLCEWNCKSGDCVSNFRNHQGDKEEVINFEKDSQLFRLHYKIGNTLYPLGDTLNHNGESVTMGFYVTEKNLEDTDEAKLVIKADPHASHVRVVLLSFYSCAGYGKKASNPHVGIGGSNISTAIKMQYRVNLYTREIK